MANKYAIISVDNNPDYYSLVPLVCLSWFKLGYTPVVICYGIPSGNFMWYCPEGTIMIDQPSIKGVRDSTSAQVSRLYAGSMHLPFGDDDILITGDSDMIVMKDIFTHEGDFVCYGYDLTGRSEIPICYIQATVRQWRRIFGKLKSMPDNAYSDDWNLYWGVDQQIATKTIQGAGLEKLVYVDRGNDQSNHGLPIGRWDRYKWENIPQDIIDVHILRSPLANWDKITEMAKRLWPDEDFEWLTEFYNELKQSK